MNFGMLGVYFKVPLFLVRLGGVPVGVRKVSKLNSLYNETLAVCFYSMCLSAIMDFVVKRDDIVESMKSVRIIFATALVAWMHLNLR
jgi:hypothetical protein